MLLAVLLHLLIFHLLTASDAPLRKDPGLLMKHVDSCPDVGYFLKREATANSLEPNVCFLCFCQGDHSAVCWKRDNRRCSKESFHYHGVGKRNTRIKRSPGFTDIFFRDASRDYFNKNTKTQCKPYESSFSDDCPPADWCVGCTVCDCDANGRWDCHLLSFCPDDKNKSKQKAVSPNPWVLPPGIPLPFMGHIPENVGKPKASSINPSKKRLPVKKYKIPSKPNKTDTPTIKREAKKKPVPKKRVAKKSIPLKSEMTPQPKKTKTKINYKKVAPNTKNSTKEMIIKKNISTRNPININTNKANVEKAIARKIMKRIMQNLKKTVSSKVKMMADTVRQQTNEMKNLKAKAKLSHINKSKRQIKKATPGQKMSKVPMKKPVYKAKGKPSRTPAANQYVRNKRDIKMTKAELNSSDTGNPEDPTSTTVSLNVMPVSRKSLVLDNDNFSQTPMSKSTLSDVKYYKYTVGSEEPNAKLNRTREDSAATELNITQTVFNLLGTQFNFEVSSKSPAKHINNETNRRNNFTEIISTDNVKSKYLKRPTLKIPMAKKIFFDSDIKPKRFMNWMQPKNKTITNEDKNRNFDKKIEKKLNSRKYYNMVKLLSHTKCNFGNCNINSSNNEKSPNKGNTTKEFNAFYKNSTTYPSKRRRKSKGLLKYLKGIFNKMFKGANKKHDQFNKHQLINTLCENFGPCKVNRKDKVVLNSKLTDLDKETKKILKTVRIIKGLLKLLELPKTVCINFTKQENFQNDIEKLNIILKSNYSENEQVVLTDTQRIQIQYIKRSTQDFIQSVNKFASLLNEIIAILTKEETNHFKNDMKRNFMNKVKDPFQSLRILLLKYNLIQNKFMKHMYEQINKFENKIYEKPKVSEVVDLNNSLKIETISRNLIQNLRKLKRLAQTVNYSGRSKRQIGRDDDAIEYLLMLMEHIVKQNHPLDSEPVNDGIDLLIEAIKSAPDIKPIKKKVLEDAPALYTHSSTTTTRSTAVSESIFSTDDNPSEIEKYSTDDNDKPNLKATEMKLNDNKDLVEIVADDEKEFEDKQFDRRAEPEKADMNTEMSFFSKFENNIIMAETETNDETTTYKNSIPLEVDTSGKLEGQDDTYTEKTFAIESSDSEKPRKSNGGGGDKKIEVFSGDVDDEIILPSTVTTESDMSTTMPSEFPTRAMNFRTKILYSNQDSVANDSVDNKYKLRWIEENFGKDTQNESTDIEDNNSTLSVSAVPTMTTITEKTIASIDVSSISKEKKEKPGHKKEADKLSAEEVMFRKQMELLNSLDYGTERQEVYEVDSKDSNVEERYTGDNFPSYFV